MLSEATTVANIRDGVPPNSVYIGRAGRGLDGKWGNPISIGDPDPNDNPMDREQVIAWYRRYLQTKLFFEPDFLEPLRGKILLCFCKPLACHGDVIVEFLDRRK